jgi:hypothetical protein
LWTWQVARPELLAVWLLEMAVGSKTTPKGGTAAYLAAQIGSELPTACGLRSMIKRTEGQFGFGAYADEPWSLQVR